MKPLGMIADVGGTNIRLATISIESGEMGEVKTYLCADFSSIFDVLTEFLSHEKDPIKYGCIDVACPVDSDWISLTNNPWQFSVSQTRKDLGFDHLFLINDYTAIAMAIPSLTDTQKVKIGEGQPIPNRSIAVCGPGTGLGVAFLKFYNNRWICLDGEGGHVDFAPQTELEDFLLRQLRKIHQHVSAERFITGPGLVNIYEGVMAFYDEKAEKLQPAEITARALSGKDVRCKEVLDLFCALLGAFAGNLAVSVWASGGVYIAGGIAPRIIEIIAASEFRSRFVAKGRFGDSLKKFPTYIITEPQPGLIGAAAFLRQELA
ncbi:glucokinase [bacterium]|nr:glucokinase [bacterium]